MINQGLIDSITSLNNKKRNLDNRISIIESLLFCFSDVDESMLLSEHPERADELAKCLASLKNYTKRN